MPTLVISGNLPISSRVPVRSPEPYNTDSRSSFSDDNTGPESEYCKINEVGGRLEASQTGADFGSSQLQIFTNQGKEAVTYSEKPPGEVFRDKTVFEHYKQFSDEPTHEYYSALLEALDKKKLDVIQLGSTFFENFTSVKSILEDLEAKSVYKESRFVSGIQRVLMVHGSARPEIKRVMEENMKAAGPLKILAGLPGAAVMGRGNYSIDEFLSRFAPKGAVEFITEPHEKQMYAAVAGLLENLYGTPQRILTKLGLHLDVKDVRAYGNTAGGSNPGYWLLMENGDFHAFELEPQEFKRFRNQFSGTNETGADIIPPSELLDDPDFLSQIDDMSFLSQPILAGNNADVDTFSSMIDRSSTYDFLVKSVSNYGFFSTKTSTAVTVGVVAAGIAAGASMLGLFNEM